MSQLPPYQVVSTRRILAIMASPPKKTIKTFTLGFKDFPEIDERNYANIVSKNMQLIILK